MIIACIVCVSTDALIGGHIYSFPNHQAFLAAKSAPGSSWFCLISSSCWLMRSSCCLTSLCSSVGPFVGSLAGGVGLPVPCFGSVSCLVSVPCLVSFSCCGSDEKSLNIPGMIESALPMKWVLLSWVPSFVFATVMLAILLRSE